MPRPYSQKHGRRYPWRKWFDTPTFTLTKGVDYNGRTDTMATQVRQNAPRFGKRVSIRIVTKPDSLVVTVY